MKTLDLTGRVFGHLTVIDMAPNKNGRTAWNCHCDCGNDVVVTTKYLRNGHAVSCGHLKRDRNHSIAPGYDAKRVDGVATFLLDRNRKVRSDSSTGITGVKVSRARDGSTRYVASITVAGVRHHLGTFETLERAKLAREKGEDEFIPKNKPPVGVAFNISQVMKLLFGLWDRREHCWPLRRLRQAFSSTSSSQVSPGNRCYDH